MENVLANLVSRLSAYLPKAGLRRIITDMPLSVAPPPMAPKLDLMVRPAAVLVTPAPGIAAGYRENSRKPGKLKRRAEVVPCFAYKATLEAECRSWAVQQLAAIQ